MHRSNVGCGGKIKYSQGSEDSTWSSYLQPNTFLKSKFIWVLS